MTASQTVDKFLDTVPKTDCLCQESVAMSRVVDISTMTRLLAATYKQVSWQWRNDDAVGALAFDRSGAEFSSVLLNTGNGQATILPAMWYLAVAL